jgi:hypothetical protein
MLTSSLASTSQKYLRNSENFGIFPFSKPQSTDQYLLQMPSHKQFEIVCRMAEGMNTSVKATED